MQEDGTVIKNIISDSGDGGDENLHMTYVFEFDFPGIEEGSEEEKVQLGKMKGVSVVSEEVGSVHVTDDVVDGENGG